MNARAKTLFIEALQLPTEERAALAHELLDTLDGAGDEDQVAVEAAWAKEIARRVDDMDAGRSRSVDADEAMRLARERVREVRGRR